MQDDNKLRRQPIRGFSSQQLVRNVFYLNNFVKILSLFSYKLCGFMCVCKCRHISRAFAYKLIHVYVATTCLVNIKKICCVYQYSIQSLAKVTFTRVNQLTFNIHPNYSSFND